MGAVAKVLFVVMVKDMKNITTVLSMSDRETLGGGGGSSSTDVDEMQVGK